MTNNVNQQITLWPIEQFIPYAKNPRKNDDAVDRMCASIREFGFKIPMLARSNGEVVDGHLRLKAARKLSLAEIPVILCDEWTPAQVKAFRLMVNRSVTWADWDEELLALELQEIQESDFDLNLTGFDPGEIDNLLALNDEEEAIATPPLPETPVTQPGDIWLLGPHRVLCGDATDREGIARLLGERKPRLLVTDPPYGIEQLICARLLIDCMGFGSPLVGAKNIATITGYYILHGCEVGLKEEVRPVGLDNVIVNQHPAFFELFPTSKGTAHVMSLRRSALLRTS